jgi:hypothetical protein
MLLGREGNSIWLSPLLGSGRKTTEICNENLDPEEQKQSKRAFRKFVEDTVAALIDIENESRRDRTSSLSVFCRVDVAVYNDNTGKFHYYVNEIERSLTVGLFRSVCLSHSLSMINLAIRRFLPMYIQRSKAQNL